MMYLGDKPIKAVLSLLPDEYQELEYIESTGTQYINTGVIPSSNLNTYMDWEWVGNNSTAYSFAFGSRTSHQQQGYGLFIYNAGTNQFGKVAFNYGFADSSFTSETRVRGRHILRIEGGVLYIEDKVVYNFSAQTFTGKYPIIVFSGTNAGAIYSGNAPSKLYNLKLYDSGTLVRDFIPCYRKSDNEIGLYDLVNKVFYTNKGTGTFLKGENKTTILEFTAPIKKCTGNNLLNIFGRTKAEYDGNFGNTAVRDFDENKYYVGMTRNNYWQELDKIVIDFSDIGFTISGGGSGYGVVFPVKCKSNTKYALSADFQLEKTGISVGYYTREGVYIRARAPVSGQKTFTFTTPDNCGFVTCTFVPYYGTTDTFTNVMLNEGDTALPYEPYKEWYEY